MRWQLRILRNIGASGIREWALAGTMCRAGRHSRPRTWIFKFNGGRGAWLCRNCRLILQYGHRK
jgi:hypothetical protein